MAEYVRAALDLGLSDLGFSDHLPWPGDGVCAWNMAADELPGYVAEVRALREQTPGMGIWLGVEADYVPGTEERLRALLRTADFDYVIGSVHFLPAEREASTLWGFDNPDLLDEWQGRDVDAVFREHLRLLADSALLGLFHVIGHCDLPKKFGHRPAADLTPEMRSAARAFHEADVLVELNTAGLRNPAQEIYPSQTFLRILREEGVCITFGSDAHRPECVGYALGDAAAWARGAGYREAYRCVGRGEFAPVSL
jgi:histidinol-phosphatase (PHP family)